MPKDNQVSFFPSSLISDAIFSPDKKYRYALWRIWDSTKPLVCWYMLNPSTANEEHDDPTIRKCRGFASRWGKGGILVLNLFNLVTPNPKDLLLSNQIGEPLKYQTEINELPPCNLKVCGWGGLVPNELKYIARIFIREYGRDAFCLGINQDGSPKHPLYVPYSTELREFNAKEA